jgi:hypothetical protein
MKTTSKAYCSVCGNDLGDVGMIRRKKGRYNFLCLNCASIPLCLWLKDLIEKEDD